MASTANFGFPLNTMDQGSLRRSLAKSIEILETETELDLAELQGGNVNLMQTFAALVHRLETHMEVSIPTTVHDAQTLRQNYKRVMAFVDANLEATQPAVLTLSGPLAYVAGAAAGTLVASIGNVPSGATPTLTPGDGRLVIGGDEVNGWTVRVGLSTSTTGTINLTVAASGAVNAAAPVSVLPAPSNNIIGAFGDSRSQPNSSDFIDTKSITVQGYMAWALLQLEFRARFGRNCNFGVGGSQTGNSESAPKGMTSSRLEEVANSAAGVIIFLGGVNDPDAPFSIANYITILNRLALAGKVVILCNELPFTSGNADQKAAQIARRNWLEDPQRKIDWPNIVQVDTFRACLKEGTICDFKDGFAPYQSTQDQGGLHPLTEGNIVIGRTIGAAIAPMFANHPSDLNLPTSTADLYNAATNPSGCLVGGFMMTGTGGTKDNVANPGVPTGWNVTTTNAGGATVTLSKTLDSLGNEALRVAVVPTGVAGTRTISVACLTNNATNLGYLAGGEKVASCARVKMSSPGPCGVAVGAQVNGTYGGVAGNLTAYSFAGTSVSSRTSELEVVVASQVADVNAGWNTGTARIFGFLGNITFLNDGPSFEVEISQAGIKKVAA